MAVLDRCLARAVLCLLLAAVGGVLASASAQAQPAISVDPSEITEYWHWASGVAVSGQGFAPSANVTVLMTDPAGAERLFATTANAQGAFSVQVNAMRNRSVLGQHVIRATDAAGGSAWTQLSVIGNPDEVLGVSAQPSELKISDFVARGTAVRITGLTLNGRVRINLFGPSENGGELMTTKQLFADPQGEYAFVLDTFTEISGAGITEVVPVEGIWRISAQDFAGTNSHIGAGAFRMLPDNPSTQSYCPAQIFVNVEPITYVGFAGIDSASPVDSGSGYESFIDRSGEVVVGQSYPLRLRGKARWPFHANTYTVFIDWNRNGILDDPNEIHAAGALLGSTGIDGMELIHHIQVPADAVLGPTRMRVLKVFSPSSFAMFWPTGACGDYRSGQIEDYTLLVQPAALFSDGFEPGVFPPRVTKVFAPASVAVNTQTQLTITLTNPNDEPAELSADLLDQFPAGLVSAANASTTCAGGAGIAQTGSSVALQRGAQIPAQGSCTISVQVAAQRSGQLLNTIPVGALQTDLGSNLVAGTATLNVAAPILAPTVSKQFASSSVMTQTQVAMTITLSNPNATPATLITDLVDNFPNGLVSAANASTTCVGGLGILQTGRSVTLQSAAVIPAAGACTITVHVAATIAGELTNTIPIGALVTSHGSNAAAGSATLTAIAPSVPPSVSKQFAASSVALNTPIGMTITLSNPNATVATLSANLVDSFPSGLVSAANASTTCTGTVLQTGRSVGLQAGATIPANGSCTISVQVAANAAGDLTNTIEAGGLVTNHGSNAAAASATLTVPSP